MLKDELKNHKLKKGEKTKQTRANLLNLLYLILNINKSIIKLIKKIYVILFFFRIIIYIWVNFLWNLMDHTHKNH